LIPSREKLVKENKKLKKRIKLEQAKSYKLGEIVEELKKQLEESQNKVTILYEAVYEEKKKNRQIQMAKSSLKVMSSQR
jgi:uncharacterized protein (UPF0128 family)